MGQLKVEHTALLKRLTDMNQKYDVASVDNRILKADIETLRAKVWFLFENNGYMWKTFFSQFTRGALIDNSNVFSTM